jgi:hypothetical protein
MSINVGCGVPSDDVDTVGWVDGRWMKQDLNDTNVVHIFVHHSISAMTCMFGTLASYCSKHASHHHV